MVAGLGARGIVERLEHQLAEPPDYGHGEGSPGVARREVDRVLLERLCARAASIERVLSGDGEAYDECESCGEQIHHDRLAVLPGTRICARCARGEA